LFTGSSNFICPEIALSGGFMRKRLPLMVFGDILLFLSGTPNKFLDNRKAGVGFLFYDEMFQLFRDILGILSSNDCWGTTRQRSSEALASTF
jgi:hypothetical protein